MATKNLRLLRIISGGQTGADQGALIAARELGIATGGTAPKGWWTESGCQEELLRSFGLAECAEPGYDARTRQNVIDADATLILGSDATGGTALTATVARHANKPLFNVPFSEELPRDAVEEFRQWLKEHDIRTLNVAGNRESDRPGIAKFTHAFLRSAFQQ